MRRFAVAIAAALALTSSAAVRAQTPAPNSRPGPVARVIRASLAGIALTDAEKTKLGEVRGVYAPKFKAVADAMKPIRVRMKAAREAKDTAGFRAARVELRKTRQEGVAVLHATLVDVRSSLAPEHQAKFDTNVVRVRRMIRKRFAP